MADITSYVSSWSSSHLACLPLEFVTKRACFEQSFDHSQVPLVYGVAVAVTLDVELAALFKLFDTLCSRIVYLCCERHIDELKVAWHVERNSQILIVFKF